LNLAGELLQPQFFQITTPDQLALPAMLIRPDHQDDQQRTPVLIEVYGGPQAPTVADRWMGVRTLYRELLARQGIATLMVDNRSSAGRGLADTWAIRGRVGEVEFQDLMTAVQWLQAQPWVATDRIAIRGWSFGGFLTTYALTHSQAFAAGIAGGSVTDWREYDAFYTERYMGLPSENPDGYRTTAPVRAAEQLHGSLLLIHGESDDNVHPSGTLRMAQALQDAGKDFRLMIYPDEAHAVHQPGRLWHLTLMTDRFLKEQLRPEVATTSDPR
jgi:dipeptidyl-peptidase-4